MAVQKLVENAMVVKTKDMAIHASATVEIIALNVIKILVVRNVRLDIGAQHVQTAVVMDVRVGLAAKAMVIALAKPNGWVISVIGV